MKGKSIALGLSLAISGVVAPAAQASTVLGPDSYGYRATTDVNYQFQDISATGTKILVNQDDVASRVDIGFAFDFYGTAYSQAFLSTNGLITFGGSNNSYTNGTLTASLAGAPAIATYWDDLVTYATYNGSVDPSRGVYYQTLGEAGHRRFVVQEIASRYNFNGNSINFQTVLDEASGSILMRYTQTAFGVSSIDNGASATVGIVGRQAGQVLQFSNNQASLSNDLSLCFTRNQAGTCAAPILAGVPEPSTWAMLILGFAVTGATLRRRRTREQLIFA